MEQLRLRYLGRKGEVPLALRGVAALPEADRRAAGAAWNEVRRALEEAVSRRQSEFEASSERGAAARAPWTSRSRDGVPPSAIRTS